MSKLMLAILNVFTVGVLLAQNTEVVLSIEPKNADVGEVVTITVKSNVQGDVEIDNLPSSFVYGYDVMNGMNQEMDHNTGEVITFYFLSQTGAFGKSGKFTVGPAYVKKGNKVYKSNKVTVNIGDKSSMNGGSLTAQQLKDPAFGTIQTNKSSIYEGEPILVSAKVYSKFEPSHLDGYRNYDMKGAVDKHAIGNSSRIVVEQERYRGYDLYTFEYDKNILFPTGTGLVKINPYSMNLHQGYKSFVFSSNYATVDIKPLPANPPQDFIGAVGQFEIERIIEEVDLKQGDVFKMTIIISGVGNLHNIIEPTPELPKGCIIYGDPSIEENISYGSKGSEGEINYEYNVQVNKAGDINLPATTISYFDISKETYVTVSTDEKNIQVKADKNYIVREVQTDNQDNLEDITGINVMRKSKVKRNNDFIYGTSFFWAGVSAPIFFAFLFLLVVKRRKTNSQKIKDKQIIKRKDKTLGLNIEQLKSLIDSNEHDAFYSGVENVLVQAMELQIMPTEDRKINRQEIFAFLTKSYGHDLEQRAKNIFSECDQNRFGFVSNQDSKKQLLESLTFVLNELKP